MSERKLIKQEIAACTTNSSLNGGIEKRNN